MTKDKRCFPEVWGNVVFELIAGYTVSRDGDFSFIEVFEEVFGESAERVGSNKTGYYRVIKPIN